MDVALNARTGGGVKANKKHEVEIHLRKLPKC